MHSSQCMVGLAVQPLHKNAPSQPWRTPKPLPPCHHFAPSPPSCMLIRCDGTVCHVSRLCRLPFIIQSISRLVHILAYLAASPISTHGSSVLLILSHFNSVSLMWGWLLLILITFVCWYQLQILHLFIIIYLPHNSPSWQRHHQHTVCHMIHMLRIHLKWLQIIGVRKHESVDDCGHKHFYTNEVILQAFGHCFGCSFFAIIYRCIMRNQPHLKQHWYAQGLPPRKKDHCLDSHEFTHRSNWSFLNIHKIEIQFDLRPYDISC